MVCSPWAATDLGAAYATLRVPDYCLSDGYAVLKHDKCKFHAPTRLLKSTLLGMTVYNIAASPIQFYSSLPLTKIGLRFYVNGITNNIRQACADAVVERSLS